MDRVTGGQDRKTPDPSLESHRDGPTSSLVYRDRRSRPDRARKWLAHDRENSYSQRLPDPGIHRYGVLGRAWSFGIDGNVVHTHVVLHRMIRMDGRIHGIPPVKDLTVRLFRRILPGEGFRTKLFRKKDPPGNTGTDNGSKCKGKSQQGKCFTVHGVLPEARRTGKKARLLFLSDPRERTANGV